MTPTKSTENPKVQDISSTSSSSAPSYASATKKAVASSPAVATSSQSPAVAVGNTTQPGQQNGKASSISPLNGRVAVTPAVPVVSTPAVAHGNGDHSRKGSVILGGGFLANGGPVGGQSAKIQFGSLPESPAAVNSAPQIASSTSAPIPIPHNPNPRITSPAQSPSPIPHVPQVSGGARPLQPGSTQPPNMIFGSLTSNGDATERSRQGPPQGPPVVPQGHMRQHSAHSDMNGPAGNGGGRVSFQQGNRGRGGFNNYNGNMNYHIGSNAPQYRGPNPGRSGGMAPSFQSQGRSQQQYPGSPNMPSRSPALAHAIPGTPNMSQAMPMPPNAQYPVYPHGQPQFPVYQQAQVYSPSFTNSNSRTKSGKGKKSKQGNGSRGTFYRESSRGCEDQQGPPPSYRQSNRRQRQLSDRSSSEEEQHRVGAQFDVSAVPLNDQNPVAANGRKFTSSSLHGQAESFKPRTEMNQPRVEHIQQRIGSLKVDLSPSSGNFERLKEQIQEQFLTSQQNYSNFRPTYDPMTGQPMAQPFAMYTMNYPQMAHMPMHPPGSPSQAYQNLSGQQGTYIPGQYRGEPMSRSSSQISESQQRPNSSLGHPPAVSMTPVTQQQAPKPVVPAAASFKVPKRASAALQIKHTDGTVLELGKLPLKTPASPAPSARTSTPPVVVSSSLTPPPKSTTPQTVRTDSPAAKTAEQKISEFKNQISKAVPSENAAAEAKVAEEEAAKAAEKKLKEEAEQKAEEEAEAVAKADAELKAKEEAESKAKAEAELKAKEEAEAAAKAKSEADAAAAKVEPAQETEQEYQERMIREMEEAEALELEREKAYETKKKAEKEALAKLQPQKDPAEEDRKLREQERLMEALEDEKERKRLAREKGEDPEATKEALPAGAPKTLASKLSSMTLADSSPSSAPDEGSMGPPISKFSPAVKERAKPAKLNLEPLNTKQPVEAPQPSAALQSLKSARFLSVFNASLYPEGIQSPNPALNPAATAKGKTFKYDKEFLLQFQKVFTEKPSLEFESQIKALIGDGDSGSGRSGSTRTPGGGMAPRQGSHRNNAPGNFAMGNFGSTPGGVGAIPRPQSQSFGRPGGVFGGSPMNRTASSSHMSNQMPQSPRQGNNNRSQRNNSKRADTSNDAKAAKTMPLTAGMDLKPIAVTASGWKPTSIGRAATGAAGPTPGAVGGHMQPDMVQRKVKAALNKMTPENFDRISDQILTIVAQSKDEADGRTLRQVIQLTFEKATDEAHWASMYAKFCKRMLETMSPEIRDEGIFDKNGSVVSGGNLFRKYLLNRCQEEFERGWKMDLPDKPEDERGEEKTEEAAMLSEEYYVAAAAKRRGLGLVQFIGELYKLSMLTERIMHECVKKLVDYGAMPDEAEVESLTKLLKTIGANLDNTEKGKPLMDAYFDRITGMIEIPDLPSRLSFMLMDIVDLRKKNWQSKEDNKGPKTLEEVRAEAEAAAAKKAAENARPQQRGGGNARMQMGRGDGRYGNQYGGMAPPPDHNRNATVGMDDLRRLQGNKANRQSSGPGVFGPSSMFANRSSSGRKMNGSMRGTADNSGASSRTATPPQQSSTTANSFSLLADVGDSGDTETIASPPTSNANPASNTENDS